MKIAVVILNWNGEKYLKQFMPSLIERTQLADVEIFVADNASTDSSIELLKQSFPTISIIELDQNYGFAGGYNKALEQIDAEYYLLLNSDVEVTENWLLCLQDYMECNKDVVACQPKIKSFLNKNNFEHAGAAGGFIDYLGFPYCRGRVFGSIEQDNGQYDEVVDIFWASGACLMIRSEIFKKVGAFDETFFAHMEEIDLCWRLNARGYRIVCVPQSVVYHVGGGTLNAESPHKTYLNFRNNLLMLYKNLPQKALKEVMLKRSILDYVAALQLFITGKPKNAMSAIKARKDFLSMQSDYDEKRKENILFATRTDCNEMYKKSIVIEHYIRRIKTFKILVQK